MKTMQTALVIALAALLAACGGGGDTPPVTDDRDIPNNPQMRAEAQEALGSADTLLMTDLYVLVPGTDEHSRWRRNHGIFQGIGTQCDRDACALEVYSRFHGDVEETRLAEFSPLDAYEAQAPYQGIPRFVGRAVASANGRTLEHWSYGGWMDHTWFWVSATNVFVGEALAPDAHEGVVVTGVSIGNDSGTRPISGAASWHGAMVGVESEWLHDIQGAATVTVDFEAAHADVSFTGIRNADTGAALPAMRWADLPIAANGRFAPPRDVRGRGATLVGTFYGPAHEEVGGVFERDEIAGAFGARRQ